MNQLQISIGDIAEIIKLSVAPVFLLAGIGGLLMVLTNRLARIIDRSRSLRLIESEFMSDANRAVYQREQRIQVKRIKLIHAAISFATASAIIICLLIVALFVGNLSGANVSTLIALLFILCMISLGGAFILLLIEILISNRGLKAMLIHHDSFRSDRAEEDDTAVNNKSLV